MRQMFESATLKLTAWYLAILMTTCIFFSVIIFQISNGEVTTRIDSFEKRLERPKDLQSFLLFRQAQLDEAQLSLFMALLYSNLVILLLGGIGCYVLARRTLQPIEQTHEAIARFTSDASHELRTPLAIMKSELEVALRDSKMTKRDMRALLESNLEEVNRLSELSQTLLQLSRQQYSDVEMKRVNLAEVVARAQTALGEPAERVQASISAKLWLRANPSSLTELIMILLDNALRYSPSGSAVRVKATTRGQYIALRIHNEGQGIAADDLPHIFEPFYRGDKSRTGTSGYGLGLSLAKKLADLHGASLELTSKPGKLTTATIWLKK